MCEFLSAIFTRDGRLLFTERDSHTVVISRADMSEESELDQNFVRLELNPLYYTADKVFEPQDVRIDEYSIPPWFEDADLQLRAKQKMIDLAAKLTPLYRELTAQLDGANSRYYERCNQLENELRVEKDALRADYAAKLTGITGFTAKRDDSEEYD